MAQAKFEFRLEALLKHRAQIEKEKQRKMALIQQEMQILTRELQEAQRRIAAEERGLSARELTGRLDMQYIAHEKRYVGNLHLKIALACKNSPASSKNSPPPAPNCWKPPAPAR